MGEIGADRRRFLKEFVVGAGAVAVGTTGCAPADHQTTEVPSFDEAWAAARTNDARWQVVRNQFLLEPGYAYLNTGGLGPSPRPVINAVDAAWRALESRCDTGHGRRADVRRRVCAFVHCGEDEIALTRNATEGMNLVARGLRLEWGAEIVMTTHEHPGGAMPWFAAAEDEGFVIKTIEPGSGGDDTLQRLATALSERTRVVMVSHVTCTTGLVMPVAEIAGLCRRRGLVSVIDGAQAPGQIPVDLHALGCDFYVASGHKWLLGPKGTGLLYVRNAMLDRWRPSYVGAYSDAGFDLGGGVFERLRPASASEYGTRNTPLVLGSSAALGFLSTIGMDLVAARAASLAMRLRERLAEVREIEILTPPDPGAQAGILTFRLPVSGGDPWDWSNRLRNEHGFRLRPVGEAGLSAVRASTHVFNTEEQIDRLGEVLRELV